MLNRAGTIQSVSVHYRYRHQPICINTTIMLYLYRWWWQLQNNKYSEPKTIRFTQFNKNHKHIEFDLNYVELLCFEKKRSLCFRTSICRIHCIDQYKTFTLLLKSKILDFETFNRVHLYRIEYVSYWQGPYRICIDTADERIVPALMLNCYISNELLMSNNYWSRNIITIFIYFNNVLECPSN